MAKHVAGGVLKLMKVFFHESLMQIEKDLGCYLRVHFCNAGVGKGSQSWQVGILANYTLLVIEGSLPVEASDITVGWSEKQLS